ncbi:hypothetical protein L2E82_47053 [Cichorium intybus]|uniref:Uncharacterized protein n=1 Tax=Cichorium intybus TaxID=13427 RepID=A0ACB8YUR4_CICIN|nr:hypothetical protein L2E82_47053 [Cichorium intybus]
MRTQSASRVYLSICEHIQNIFVNHLQQHIETKKLKTLIIFSYKIATTKKIDHPDKKPEFFPLQTWPSPPSRFSMHSSYSTYSLLLI